MPNREISRAELAFLLDTREVSDPEVLDILISSYADFVARLILALEPAARQSSATLRARMAQTFVRSVQGHNDFLDSERIRVWLARHAIVACQKPDQGSRPARFFSSLLNRSDDSAPDQILPNEKAPGNSQEEADGTLAAIDKLGDPLRIPMILRYAAHFSIPNIQQTLQRPKSSIQRSLLECREQLLLAGRRPSSPLDLGVRRQVHAAFDESVAPGDSAAAVHLAADRPVLKPLVQALAELEQVLIHQLAFHAGNDIPAVDVDKLSDDISTGLKAADRIAKKGFRLPLWEIMWIGLVSAGFLWISQRLVPVEVEAPATPPPLVLPTQTVVSPATPAQAQLGDEELIWRKSRTFIPSPNPVNSLDYSPDGRYLAIGYQDSWVRIWGFFDESRIFNLQGQGSPTTVVQYSPNGDYLVAGSADGTIRLWETDFFRTPVVLDDRGGSIRGAAFSPDSRLFAIITDRRLWLWEIQDRAFVRFYERSGERLSSVSFSPRGDFIAIADGETITVLKLEDLSEMLTYQNHEERILRLVFSTDGRKIASASPDGTVHLVDLVSPAEGLLDGHLTRTFRHPAGIEDIAFSPEGGNLAVTSSSGAVYFWDLQAGTLTSLIENGGRGITFSPDGRRMATIGEGGSILVWVESP